MNIILLAQIIGTLSLLLLFCINFYIGIDIELFYKAGRVAILWTTIFIFFLFFLRLLSLLHIGTMQQLQIISGFTSPIPLIAVIVQLYLTSKLKKDGTL